MTDTITKLWVDKYRPSSLKDYILNADLKMYFKNNDCI